MAVVFYKWLLFSALLFGSQDPERSNSGFHPFFVSITEINHNAGDKNLEISCKIFTDDFETSLSKTYNTRMDLINIKDKQLADKLITDYIRKHLVIKLNGKIAVLEFVGFERESEAIWSYFQVSNTAAPKKVEIINNILYDSFDKQINLIHVSVDGNRKSTRLIYPEANVKLEF